MRSIVIIKLNEGDNVLKKCPNCNSTVSDDDVFCGACGNKITDITMQNFKTANNEASQKEKKTKNIFMVIFFVFALLILITGSIYWTISQKQSSTVTNQDYKEAVTQNGIANNEDSVNLALAKTYLPKPGLKCEFFLNYPDGQSGPVTRISANLLTNSKIIVSESESNFEAGAEYGYGFYYLELKDGVYLIYDQNITHKPTPIIKNNPTIGQTWTVTDDFGTTTWKVVALNENLNLDFKIIENCLVIEEYNDVFGLKTLTYYAPNLGRVLVKHANSGAEYFKLIKYTEIEKNAAIEEVKRWSPNYINIEEIISKQQ